MDRALHWRWDIILHSWNLTVHWNESVEFLSSGFEMHFYNNGKTKMVHHFRNKFIRGFLFVKLILNLTLVIVFLPSSFSCDCKLFFFFLYCIVYISIFSSRHNDTCSEIQLDRMISWIVPVSFLILNTFTENLLSYSLYFGFMRFLNKYNLHKNILVLYILL